MLFFLALPGTWTAMPSTLLCQDKDTAKKATAWPRSSLLTLLNKAMAVVPPGLDRPSAVLPILVPTGTHARAAGYLPLSPPSPSPSCAPTGAMDDRVPCTTTRTCFDHTTRRHRTKKKEVAGIESPSRAATRQQQQQPKQHSLELLSSSTLLPSQSTMNTAINSQFNFIQKVPAENNPC